MADYSTIALWNSSHAERKNSYNYDNQWKFDNVKLICISDSCCSDCMAMVLGEVLVKWLIN